jgi:hypothetical protein
MNLAQLVPTLEVCQSLRKAGFPQDTALSWVEIEGGYQCDENGDPQQEMPPRADVVFADSQCHGTMLCAAPTAEEILRVLPVLIRIREDFAGLRSWVSTSNDFSFYVGWQAYHIPSEKEDPWYGADKFSEAAALAYLWWKEQE